MRWSLASLAAFSMMMSMAACDRGTPSPPAAGADGAAAVSAKGETTGSSVAWVMPRPDLGYNAREGRFLFGHYCATCHGEEGRGDGFNAYNLDPKPRDLTDATFQEKKTDSDLEEVIRIGGGASGLSSAMPPWGHTLSELQIHNLVVYLRNLPEDE